MFKEKLIITVVIALAVWFEYAINRLQMDPPSMQYTVEHSIQFRLTTQRAWNITQDGLAERMEAGFTVDKDGHFNKITFERNYNQDAIGSLHQLIGPNTLLALHTHSNESIDTPSPKDIEVAKFMKVFIYVQSKTGLYVVDSTGKVQKVFDGVSWMSSR